MRQKAAIYLYRHLLKACRHQLVEQFPGMAINIRVPVSSTPGTYTAHAVPGLQYQLECLQTLVPGLSVVPQEQQLPLTYMGLKHLIRDNFKANKDLQQDQPGATSSISSALDQGFCALRALPLLAYLESCSSSSLTDGILVEVTSSFSHSEPPSPSTGPAHWFKYRVRITNQRQAPIKVLGRGWLVTNHTGELQGLVALGADNGIVGQRPTIPPGECFEYTSCSPLKSAAGPGQMVGQLMVELCELAAPAGSAAAAGDDEAAGDELAVAGRVAVPVAPFKLQTMAVAAAAAAAARQGSVSETPMESGTAAAADSATATEQAAGGCVTSSDDEGK